MVLTLVRKVRCSFVKYIKEIIQRTFWNWNTEWGKNISRTVLQIKNISLNEEHWRGKTTNNYRDRWTFIYMLVSVPIWWNTSSLGRLEATWTNFLWLLRTNDEALCVYVWVAHLALKANNLCVCVSAFFHVPVGTCIYFCASKCVYLHCMYLLLCILVLSDVCVNVPTHAQSLKFAHHACVCTFVPSVCLACCERWRRFCSSDTATVSCRHIQSRRNHYTMFSVIN